MGSARTVEQLKEILLGCRKFSNEKGCWLWQGKVNSTGYGTLSGLGCHGTHRVAYAVFNEQPGRLHVLHSCDEPRCCNPEHLRLGTHSDNMQESIRKKRAGRFTHPGCFPSGENHWTRRPGVKLLGQRGEDCPSAKLTWEQVKRIREMYAAGEETQYTLATMFGVSQTQIGRIIRGKRWAI